MRSVPKACVLVTIQRDYIIQRHKLISEHNLPLLDALCERKEALFNEADFAGLARTVGQVSLAVAEGLVAAAQAAERNGIDGAVKLRQRVEHHGLQPADALLEPRLDVLDQQRRRHEVRHILGKKNLLCHRAPPSPRSITSGGDAHFVHSVRMAPCNTCSRKREIERGVRRGGGTGAGSD
jgi:hypothetical protein